MHIVPVKNFTVAIWVVTVLSITLGVLVAIITSSFVDGFELKHQFPLSIGLAGFAVALWALFKVVVFIYVPFDMRLIYIVAYFLMSFTVIIAGGGWLDANFEIISPYIDAKWETEDSSRIAVRAITVNVPALMFVVALAVIRTWIREREATPSV